MEKNEQDVKNEKVSLLSRRDFLKFCGAIAGVLGVTPNAVAEVFTSQAVTRPPVIWLHFAECTGCTESILRTTGPWFDELIMNVISLEYHETLMAASGITVTQILDQAADRYHGAFFCVVEGAIPTAQNGIFGTIGDKTMLSIARDILPKAKAIISCGTCASYGGLPGAAPNPTGAMGVADGLPDLAVPVINVPGCPPNPVNLVAVIADYLLHNSLPQLDAEGRPVFAYNKHVHKLCPYKGVARYCLQNDGCKGRFSYNNCPSVKFNDQTSFPMQAGHPCIGCSEPGFWDSMTPFYK